MGFFDNIQKGITDFSQTTIQKGKDAASIVKLNRLISEEESKITQTFEKLGKAYYDSRLQTAPGTDSDAEELITELIREIDEATEHIREYQDEIKRLQGYTRCTACGADIPSQAAFCPECGARSAAYVEPEPPAGKPVKIFCTNCGVQIVPGYKFCSSCGQKVEPPEASSQEEPSGEEPEEQAISGENTEV